MDEELKDGFAWEPALSTESNEGTPDPEDISVEDIDTAFDDFEARLHEEKNKERGVEDGS